jgi:hypothetical protein
VQLGIFGIIQLIGQHLKEIRHGIGLLTAAKNFDNG